ncbi:hypothetical protein ACHWQZ_G015470 [Mnemiopsis leidyi]
MALGSEEERAGGLCRDIDDSEITRVFATARVGATAILGQSCPSFDIDAVAFDGECKALVRQATCYGIRAAKLYDVEVVDYGLLRSDMLKMKRLGNLACQKASACVQRVRNAMQVCFDRNENFFDETIAAAETAYRENLETRVGEFAKGNKGSILGDLVNMAMDQFSSAGEILSFIKDHLMDPDGVAAEEISDFALDIWDTAQALCDEGCTSKATKYLRRMFDHMNGGQCTDASVFCGDCQERADSFLTRKLMPFCVEFIAQLNFEAYEFVMENYKDTFIYPYVEAIRERMTETSISEAMEIKERLDREFGCAYEVSYQSCSFLKKIFTDCLGLQ